jgi:hypothetical protein
MDPMRRDHEAIRAVRGIMLGLTWSPVAWAALAVLALLLLTA